MDSIFTTLTAMLHEKFAALTQPTPQTLPLSNRTSLPLPYFRPR